MRDIIRRGERVTPLFPAQAEKPGVDAPAGGGSQTGKRSSAPFPTRNAGAVLEALRASSRAARKARGEVNVPAEGAEISDLSDRILGQTEAQFADPRRNRPQGHTATSTRPQLPPGNDAITGLGRQLDANSELFRAQGVRLSAIEKQLDEQTHRREAALQDLGTRLDKRFDAMERHFASARDRAQELRTRDHEWTQSSLGRLGRYLVIALSILTLVTLSLFALNWWRINHGLDRPERALHSEMSTLSGDLSVHFAHLEQSATDLQQAVHRVTGLVNRLNEQIGVLTKEQVELSRRLDAVTVNALEVKSPPTVRPAQSSRVKEPATVAKERYAIQLIGFRTEASVVSFARRFGLKGEVRYLKESDRGKDWYLVLLGDYASYAEAAAAEKQLPPNLKDLKPRIRPVAPGTDLTPIDGL
jgi:uncharacterized protein YukE